MDPRVSTLPFPLQFTLSHTAEWNGLPAIVWPIFSHTLNVPLITLASRQVSDAGAPSGRVFASPRGCVGITSIVMPILDEYGINDE